VRGEIPFTPSLTRAQRPIGLLSILSIFIAAWDGGGGRGAGGQQTELPQSAGCTLAGTVGYSAPGPFTISPSRRTCYVASTTDLASCVREVRDGASDAIEIRSILDCDAASSCLVDLAGVTRKVHVYGAPGVSAGFRRTADYSYPILLLRNSSNIRVSNLELNEEGGACKQCESSIRVIDSGNITLERLRVFGSKKMGIAFLGTDQLVIRDSEFANSGVFGIWSGIRISTDVTIQNNFFRDTQSNAIFLSYVKTSSILNNTFFHNHRSAIFATGQCGGPCPGGQIYVSLATGTSIASNVIAGGVIDAKNTKGNVGGIEIDRGTSNLSIQNNEIHNNAGSGVYANPSATDIRSVVIGSNKLYGNGAPFRWLSENGVDTSRNCLQ
jgi:hypothetical protein